MQVGKGTNACFMSAVTAAAEPLETLRETRNNFDLVVICFTKGQLSREEFWAECDWMASQWERAALPEGAKQVWGRYAELTAQ